MSSTPTSLLPSPSISGSMSSLSTAGKNRPPIPAFHDHQQQQQQQPSSSSSSSVRGPSASLLQSSSSSSSSSSTSSVTRQQTALRTSRITYAPPSSDRMSAAARQTPDPSVKLKRLSLVSRPVSLDLDRDSKSTLRTESSSGRGAGIGEEQEQEQEEQENVPPLQRALSPVAIPSTPRSARRGAGLRSSISYSPAPRQLTFGVEDKIGAASGMGDRPTRSLTLTDKHADLLRLIAQKERKVNEIRQELESHERALAQLKAKWTAVVSRSAPTPVAAPYISNSLSFPAPALTSTPTPTSASSSSSSISSSALPLASSASATAAPIPTTPGAQSTTAHKSSGSASDGTAAPDGYMALLQAQTEGLLGPATLQGGKRFWGQLVKTVSAAAAGTVPDDPPLDLSGLKSMLPAWASPPPPERTVPLPPSNRRRLPSDQSHDGSRSTSLQEPLVSVSGDPGTETRAGEVDLLGDDTPDMGTTCAVPPAEKGHVQPAKDENGWGW